MLYRQKTLETPHGELLTPTLFPVRNIGVRSSDNTPEYTEDIADIATAMVNARAIRNRKEQWDRLKNGTPLREELGVTDNTVVFADSGGYAFRKENLDETPKRTLETQRTIGADIFGTLDMPIDKSNTDSENQKRISRSLELALSANEMHESDELLFASVHGYDPETIRNSIAYLEKRGSFDGYGLGSLVPMRTDYNKVTKLILAARRSTEKHLHVYGLGGLVYQPLLLYLGVDSFDSSSFIRSAGKRRYLVPGFGGTEMKNMESINHPPCPCPVCCKRTLRELRSSRDLLTLHNLWALAIELRRFRYVVESGQDLEDYLDLRFQGNSVTKRAFDKAKQQVRRLS